MISTDETSPLDPADAEPIIQGCCSNTGPVLEPIFHASLGVEIVIHIVRMKDSEVQQLMNIFRFLGTPNEEVWPGVTKLKDCHIYLEWKPQDISCSVPDLEPRGNAGL